MFKFKRNFVRTEISSTSQYPKKTKGSQEGFTLIELLVSLVLGLVILGGVISIFIETRKSFRVNENLGRMQENARFGFEVLSREIREAGSTSCGVRAMASVVKIAGASPWYTDWAAGTVRGFDGATNSADIVAFGVNPLDRVNGTDAIVLLRNSSDDSVSTIVTAHELADDAFTVQTDPTKIYKPEELISICDIKSGAILGVGSLSKSLVQIEYGTGTKNCSKNLGYPTGNCTAPVPGKTFDAGSIVTKFDPVFWYVGVNSRNGRSLFKARTALSGGALEVIREEMIPFVQDMQIEYLIRNNTVLADSWVSAADAIFDSASGAWTEANIRQVVAVRLNVTVQSEEKVGATGQSLQRQFVSVSAIRSREFQ